MKHSRPVVEIREARAGDARGIARVQVDSYRTAYVGHEEFRVTSSEELPVDKLELRFEFEMTTPPD